MSMVHAQKAALNRGLLRTFWTILARKSASQALSPATHQFPVRACREFGKMPRIGTPPAKRQREASFRGAPDSGE